MSLSSGVKDELSRQVPATRHCQITGVAAVLSLYGRVKVSTSDHFTIETHTGNVIAVGKYFTLLKKTSNISTDISIRRGRNLSRNRTYIVTVREHDNVFKILQAVKLVNDQGEIRENLLLVHNVVVQNTCYRRTFTRGAFLALGSIDGLEEFYHFEIICSSMAKAEQLKGIITAPDMKPRIVLKKKYCAVYIEEGN